jgi:hypothetical protein
VIDQAQVIERIVDKGMLNPFFDQMVPMVCALLVLAGFLFWVYLRYNRTPLYATVASLQLLLALILAILGREPNPGMFFVILVVLVGTALFVLTSSLLMAVFLSQIRDYDVAPETYLDPHTGLFQPKAAAGIGGVLLVGLWLALPLCFVAGGRLLGDATSMAGCLVLLGVVATAGPKLMPTELIKDEHGLGASTARAYTDVMLPTGPASPQERLAAPLLGLIGLAMVFLLSQGSVSDNQGPLLLLIAVGGSIARTEYVRSKKKSEAGEAAPPARRK